MYVARLRKKKVWPGNPLLYATAAEVSKRALGREVCAA
jgi:hypothetical protein